MPEILNTSSLPVELLLYIFKLFCQHQALRFGENVDDASYASPLRLGSICSSWRSLAWSTPKLWSYIDIEVSQKHSRSQAEVLDAWLDRTGNLPLDIILRSADGAATDGTEDSDETTGAGLIYTALVQRCARWRTVDIYIPNSECAYILNDAYCDVPFLQKLRISSYGSDAVQFYEEASQLTHLILETIYQTSFGVPDPDFCTKVTSLFISNIEFNDTIPILSAVSNSLRHFHYEAYNHTWYPDDNFPHQIDLPCLETLVVYSDTMTLEKMMIVLLSTPKLRRLALSINDASAESDVERVVAFLGRQNITLSTIILRLHEWLGNDTDAPTAEVERFMALLRPHTSTLTELTFEIGSLCEAVRIFLEELHQKLGLNRCRQLLPSLQSYGLVILSTAIEDPHLPPIWESLLPITQSIKTWFLAPPTVQNQWMSKITFGDLEQERILALLSDEVRRGLEIKFSSVSYSYGPNWYLGD